MGFLLLRQVLNQVIVVDTDIGVSVSLDIFSFTRQYECTLNLFYKPSSIHVYSVR